MPAKKDTSLMPTGIDGLDYALGGGFQRGRSILVCGAPGTGKTTAGFQFLCKGVSVGENGAYISFDEEKEKLVSNMSQFGWDLEDMQKKDLLRVQKVGAIEIQQFATQESMILMEIIRSIGAKRVVVDSLTSYELLFKGDYERMVYIRRIIDEILNRGATLLATSEAPAGKLSRFDLAEFIFDTVINLEQDKSVRTGRTIEIVKNRGGPHKLGKSPMEISPRGIVVGTK
jgi:circadian clock protein KaiC